MHAPSPSDIVDVEFESRLPAIVTETFLVSHGSEQTFWEVCAAMRLSACRNPACLSMRVLHDRHDKARVTIVSEWRSVEAFNAFIRDSGLLWLERGANPPLSGKWTLLHASAEDLPTANLEAASGSVRS